MPRPLLRLVLACALSFASALSAAEPLPSKFSFGSSAASSGFIHVAPGTPYSRDLGYGFEPHTTTAAPPTTSTHFTARVPREGNYRITVTLGGPTQTIATTIKAELRRLMVADVLRTAPGEIKRVSFIVNTRTPAIAAVADLKSGAVRLKAPRETTQEAWAWDDALTLEFLPNVAAVRTLEIEPADVPTLYLLGDSTVCDQSKEPYASWGQMLTRFFSPDLAIANHGESGETYRDSLARRRLDKIVSLLRPGDWVFLQFGHNDQKQIAAKSGGPFTTYQAEIAEHIAAIRARDGSPVLVSPMERRNFDAHGKLVPTLADYASAARESARELDVPFIDLNALSIRLYEALGPERSARAFAIAADGKIDNTHHNNYGAYQLAKCIAQSLHNQHLPLARFVAEDFAPYDPSRPDNPDTFAVPPSRDFTNHRPLGD